MRVAWTDGERRVLEADVLDALDALEGAVPYAGVIADPPYGSGAAQSAQRAAKRGKYNRSGYQWRDAVMLGDQLDQDAWTWWSVTWLRAARALCAPDAHLMVWTDWRQIPATSRAIQASGWRWCGIVPWDKGGAARLASPSHFRHQAEFVLWGVADELPKRDRAIGPVDGVLRCAYSPFQKRHMTGKPVAVHEHLIGIMEPGPVLELFAGSAPALRACRRAGRACDAVEASAGVLAETIADLEAEAAQLSIEEVATA